MFWWGWAVKVKELRTLIGSDFFQTWKLSSWKPYLCLVTHSYSDKLVLRRIQYFITKIWCIGCAQNFNFDYILIANTNPCTWNISRIRRKMYQISARFHVVILITWIFTDTRRSKNIQKNVKFVWKIRTQHRPNRQGKKLSNLLTGFICWKHTHIFKFLINLWFKHACYDFKILMHTSKGEEINFKFQVIQFRFCQVKLRQTFIQRQVQEISTTNLLG